MKNLALLILCLSLSNLGSAQQIFLDLGSSTTSLEYLNSSGELLENLQATSNNAMQLGFRYTQPKDYLSCTVALSYTGYGAIGSDTLYQNYMEYSLNYAQLHLGLDVRFFSYKDFEFHIIANTSFGALLQGTQTQNNQVFDLVDNEEFQRTLFSLAKGIRGAKSISDDVSLFVQFINGWGVPLGINRKDDVERWKLRSNSLSFGVLIDLNR